MGHSEKSKQTKGRAKTNDGGFVGDWSIGEHGTDGAVVVGH